MYEELIQRLRETSMDFGEADHVSVMLLEAADAIEGLSGLVDHYGGETGIKDLQEYASKYWDFLKNAPRWIPVTERLPEKNGFYLCLYKYKHPGGVAMDEGLSILQLYDGRWNLNDNYAVTHWMLIPEPPEEET